MASVLGKRPSSSHMATEQPRPFMLVQRHGPPATKRSNVVTVGQTEPVSNADSVLSDEKECDTMIGRLEAVQQSLQAHSTSCQTDEKSGRVAWFGTVEITTRELLFDLKKHPRVFRHIVVDNGRYAIQLTFRRCMCCDDKSMNERMNCISPGGCIEGEIDFVNHKVYVDIRWSSLFSRLTAFTVDSHIGVDAPEDDTTDMLPPNFFDSAQITLMVAIRTPTTCTDDRKETGTTLLHNMWVAHKMEQKGDVCIHAYHMNDKREPCFWVGSEWLQQACPWFQHMYGRYIRNASHKPLRTNNGASSSSQAVAAAASATMPPSSASSKEKTNKHTITSYAQFDGSVDEKQCTVEMIELMLDALVIETFQAPMTWNLSDWRCFYELCHRWLMLPEASGSIQHLPVFATVTQQFINWLMDQPDSSIHETQINDMIQQFETLQPVGQWLKQFRLFTHQLRKELFAARYTFQAPQSEPRTAAAIGYGNTTGDTRQRCRYSTVCNRTTIGYGSRSLDSDRKSRDSNSSVFNTLNSIFNQASSKATENRRTEINICVVYTHVLQKTHSH